jgi:hypothetical protein
MTRASAGCVKVSFIEGISIPSDSVIGVICDRAPEPEPRPIGDRPECSRRGPRPSTEGRGPHPRDPRGRERAGARARPRFAPRSSEASSPIGARARGVRRRDVGRVCRSPRRPATRCNWNSGTGFGSTSGQPSGSRGASRSNTWSKVRAEASRSVNGSPELPGGAERGDHRGVPVLLVEHGLLPNPRRDEHRRDPVAGAVEAESELAGWRRRDRAVGRVPAAHGRRSRPVRPSR